MKQKGFTIPGGKPVPVLSVVICLFFLYHLKANEMISVFVFIAAASFVFGFDAFKKERIKKYYLPIK